MNATLAQIQGYHTGRVVYHLGSFYELATEPWDCQKMGDTLVHLRELGDKYWAKKDIPITLLPLALATCGFCNNDFSPVMSQAEQPANYGKGVTPCIQCALCGYQFFKEYEKWANDIDQLLEFHTADHGHGSLENLQLIMEAYRRGKNNRVELRLSSSGSGTMLLDDSWGRRGDISYIELHTWEGWNGLAHLTAKSSLEHIIHRTANPGKLPNGWNYYMKDEPSTKQAFHTYGEPSFTSGQLQTWIRYGPAKQGEVDWHW